MKKIFLLISVILFIFPVQAQHTLRLMTYNIKNANGMDDICSFQRVANVINNACTLSVSENRTRTGGMTV